MRKELLMPEKERCQTCEDIRKIRCPYCSGRGGIINHFYPLGMGKSYSCYYCGGVGKIPCPRCKKAGTIFQEPGIITETMGVFFSWIWTRLFHEKRFL